MPTYKLIYFDITGIAEFIRYLFHYGGIEFEDYRIKIEDWPKYKAAMPMKQVPVLEIDGKVYTQSRAIGRYFAKKCNLYSSDEIEALEIDAAVDSIDDMRHEMAKFYWEKDPALKEKYKEVAFEKLSFCLQKFEEQVKQNGGYFVRGKLSLADFMYAACTDYLSACLKTDLNKDHPELKKLADKVLTIPKIKAYLEKRPKTIV